MKSYHVVLAALMLWAAGRRDARADLFAGLDAFYDFNAGALGQDTTANHRDLALRANPNAYGGAGALPTTTSGVGGGTAIRMPGLVYDSRLGAPGTFFGDIFGPDPFAGGDANRTESGVFDLNAPAGYAVQAWVNFDSLPADRSQTLLAKSTDMASSGWQGWNLSAYQSSGGSSYIDFSSRTSIGAPAPLQSLYELTTGNWYQVIVNASVTGPLMQYDLIINGALVASQTNGLVNAVGDPLRLGHTTRSFGGVPELWGSPLLGSLDQVAFWSRTLSTDDIGALYNGGRGVAFGSQVPEHASSLGLTAFALAALVGFRRVQRRGELKVVGS